jgi:hypothetical protein
MARGIVLDVETRVDRLLLAASGRSSTPRDMPAPLLSITAAATLAFEEVECAGVRDMRLEGECATAQSEPAMLLRLERALARTWSEGGVLVTFNGMHDLSVLRLALLRHRMLGFGGVARWLETPGDRHLDVMRMVARGDRWPRLADVAAALGFAAQESGRSGERISRERRKAELDVVQTLLLHVHLRAERSGDARALATGIRSIGSHLARQLDRSPHLEALLRAPVFSSRLRGATVESTAYAAV